MSVDCFIDSNIFVYLFDETDPDKRQRAETLIEVELSQGRACISYQVVQETINVITRKLNATAEEAKRFLDSVLTPLWKVTPTPAFYRSGLEIQARYQYSFYDSLIIAAALEAGCSTLYSEDLQHRQRIGQSTIDNPFVG